MDPPKKDSPKLPDMIMCGDHPSFNKTELNMKEEKFEDKEKRVVSYSTCKISPSSSRTGGPLLATGGGGECRAPASEHALRLVSAAAGVGGVAGAGGGAGRRHARSLDAVPRDDIAGPGGNRALVQAALGSFRWPPYLLAVWVIVLVLTHVLHCIVTMLERALPNIRKFCHYFRTWTEDTWKAEEVNHKFCPLGLAVVTGLLYTVYLSLYVIYSVALWSIEPLCAELDDKQSSSDVTDTKITDYMDEVTMSKTHIKQQ